MLVFCQLIKYRQKRLFWIVFKAGAGNLSPLRPSSRKSLLLLPGTWDCAKHFSPCLCSVILRKGLLHLEWRNVCAKFGSLGNSSIWLVLKLIYINESEHKFFCISAALAFVYLKWWCSVLSEHAFHVWLAFGFYRWGDQSMGHCCGHYEDWWNLSNYVQARICLRLSRQPSKDTSQCYTDFWGKWEMVIKTVCLKKYVMQCPFKTGLLGFFEEDNMVSFG